MLERRRSHQISTRMKNSQAAVFSGIAFLRHFGGRSWLVIAIALACGLAACNAKPDRVQAPADFWGLTPALTKAQITNLKGAPQHMAPVSPEHPAGEFWIYTTEHSDPKLLAENEVPPGSYLVHFRAERISRIEFFGHDQATAPALMGVRAGDTLDAMTRRLGSPSHVAKSADKPLETVCYEKFRVFFAFRQNRIEAYGLYEPEFGPVEIGNQ